MCVYPLYELKMLPLFLFCCVAIEILVRVLLNKNIVNEEKKNQANCFTFGPCLPGYPGNPGTPSFP